MIEEKLILNPFTGTMTRIIDDERTVNIVIGDGQNTIKIGTTGYSIPFPINFEIKKYSIAVVNNNPSPQFIEIELYKDNYQKIYPPQTKITKNNPIRLNNQIINVVSVDSDYWINKISLDECIGFKVVGINGPAKKIQILLFGRKI